MERIANMIRVLVLIGCSFYIKCLCRLQEQQLYARLQSLGHPSETEQTMIEIENWRMEWQNIAVRPIEIECFIELKGREQYR